MQPKIQKLLSLQRARSILAREPLLPPRTMAAAPRNNIGTARCPADACSTLAANFCTLSRTERRRCSAGPFQWSTETRRPGWVLRWAPPLVLPSGLLVLLPRLLEKKLTPRFQKVQCAICRNDLLAKYFRCCLWSL